MANSIDPDPDAQQSEAGEESVHSGSGQARPGSSLSIGTDSNGDGLDDGEREEFWQSAINLDYNVSEPGGGESAVADYDGGGVGRKRALSPSPSAESQRKRVK